MSALTRSQPNRSCTAISCSLVLLQQQVHLADPGAQVQVQLHPRNTALVQPLDDHVRDVAALETHGVIVRRLPANDRRLHADEHLTRDLEREHPARPIGRAVIVAPGGAIEPRAHERRGRRGERAAARQVKPVIRSSSPCFSRLFDILPSVACSSVKLGPMLISCRFMPIRAVSDRVRALNAAGLALSRAPRSAASASRQ